MVFACAMEGAVTVLVASATPVAPEALRKVRRLNADVREILLIRASSPLVMIIVSDFPSFFHVMLHRDL
jgi:hypothetical protein